MRPKLTPDEVREIRRIRKMIGKRRRVERSHPSSVASLARRFGVTEPTITSICRRYHWRHVA